jgi:hypothetical protein
MRAARIVVFALLAAASIPARAQAPTCPHASEVRQAQLLGRWRVEIEGDPPAVLLLEKHAAYADSVSGTVDRAGQRRPVAGDVEDGEFTLEESADGVRIAAAWLGEVVEGSCGREIRGQWVRDGEQAGRPFVLRKQ